MELVFRKDLSSEKNCHDLYVKLNDDGSVNLALKAKNGTGESWFTLSSADFNRLCEVRGMVMNDSTTKAK